MTSLRTGRNRQGGADVAIRSWIGSLVEAQGRLRAARGGAEAVLAEFVRSVSGLVDAPARVALRDGDSLHWSAGEVCAAVAPADLDSAAIRALADLAPVRVDDVPPAAPLHVVPAFDDAVPALFPGEDETDLEPDPDDPLFGPITAVPRTGGIPRVAHPPVPSASPPGSGPLPMGGSVLAVPLVHAEHCLGVVVLSAPVPDWFDETDEQAVVLLAGTAAAVLTTAVLPVTQPLSLADLTAALEAVPERDGAAGPATQRHEAGRHRAQGDDDARAADVRGWIPPSPRTRAPHPPEPDADTFPGTDPHGRDDGDVTAWSAPGEPGQPAALAIDLTTDPAASLRLLGDADALRPAWSDEASYATPRFDAAVPLTGTLPVIPSIPTPAGLGLWEWDAASNEVTWSEPVAKLLGLPASGTVELDLIRSMLPEDEQRRFDDTVALVEQGEGAAGSFRVVLADGEPRRFYAWGEARRDARGGLVGAWGALVDVTEREQDAAVLRNSLAGLRAAQELTGLGVWEWHPEADRLVWSPEMYRIVGLEPGELEPTLDVWHGFVHPEDVDRVRRLDVLAADRDGGAVENFRIIGADGVVRHVQSWSTVVAAVDGSPRAVCGATVDVTRQVSDRDLLEQLSATDAVTGLGNRLAFDKAMTALLADPSRDVAVLLLDLDRFKTVNDSLGHAVGDRLLVEAARRITSVAPEGSITARMGGDEFVVVPRPGLGWLQVRRLAQAVVDALRAPYVLPESGEMLVCPASVGVTSTSGRRVDVSDLLREADLALYRAKDSGRDRYVVFDDVLRARAQARHLAERRLRLALDEGRLELEYQPIVELDTGEVVGAEALVRLREADGRLLGPEEFIDVAEDTGLVVEVDCWVIEQALNELPRWGTPPPGRPQPWLAINVSARSMEHPKVSRRILEALRTGRVTTDRLKVELTEHSFLGALPGGESYLRRLMSSGVPVGIDDFGTGYSALAYLQRFELDFMKIDRSFVASVGKDDRSDAVVTAIVDLAHAHGMRVTAEGVETDAQAARLQEIGCDFAQGFHFGMPGRPERILPPSVPC
ncbi:MAG: EAL domain-containing protein [Kineosporiaceae bacterium]